MIDVFLDKVMKLEKYWPIRFEDEWYMNFCNKYIDSIQNMLRELHGEDFTAALEIVKEAFPRHYNMITGYANF